MSSKILQAQNITLLSTCCPVKPRALHGGGLIQAPTWLCCRLCIREGFIDEKLRHLLPHDQGSPSGQAAEEALCLRM